MKSILTKEELWAVMGAIGGVWPSERDQYLESAYNKLSELYRRMK